MKCVRAWNHSETVEIGDPVKSVTGANSEHLHLHEVEHACVDREGTYVTRYLRYVSRLSRYNDGRPDIEVCEPICHRGPWPGRQHAQCHGTRPPEGFLLGRHVFDDDDAPPGHHLCSVCGHPAWIESHGMASGSCEYCGHQG